MLKFHSLLLSVLLLLVFCSQAFAWEGISPQNFAYPQCTWWADWQTHYAGWDLQFSAGSRNAYQWWDRVTNTRKSDRPEVGSVMVVNQWPTSSGAGDYGHVGYVTAVSGNSFTLYHSNYYWPVNHLNPHYSQCEFIAGSPNKVKIDGGGTLLPLRGFLCPPIDPANVVWDSTPTAGYWYRNDAQLSYIASGTSPAVVENPPGMYLSGLGLGMHDYSVSASNSAGGNTITWTGGWDNQAPDLGLNGDCAPVGTWLRGTQYAKWHWSDAHSGIKLGWYRWNGGATADGGSGVAQIPEGKNTLHIYVEDKSWNGGDQTGNSSTISADFWLDTVPPDLNPTYPETSTWLKENPTINWTVFDATSGVQEVTVQWDGGEETPVSGTSVGIPEGKHTVILRAYDNAGNPKELESTGPFWVDNTAPTITATLNPAAPNGINGWYKTAPSLKITADDPNSGIASGLASITYSIDGAAPIKYTIPVIISANGPHSITITATDVAGNDFSYDPPITCLVDTTKPGTPVITAPAFSSSTSVLAFSFNASDPHSGIAKYEYEIGTTVGGSEVKGRTSTGAVPYAYVTNLTLAEGTKYYVTVWAQNGAGLWSTAATSSAITVTASNSVTGIFSAGGVSVSARASTNYRVTDTIGQFMVGIAESTNQRLEHGYWNGGKLLPPTITTFTQTIGAAGRLVTITGTNFTRATAVKFNGKSAAFTVVNANTITAIVPGGATTGKISIITPGGTVLSAGIFTVSGMQPDLWVRGDSGYNGDDVYSADGATQSRALSVARGTTAIYYLHVQNDGAASDTLMVKSAAAPAGWTVKYYSFAGVDVTAAVTGATGWSTGTLAVGALDVGLYVKVTPISSITPGSVLKLTPKATSLTNGTKIDVGRLVTTATGYQPDLWVRGDSGYIGDNVYSADGATQIRALSIPRGTTANFYLHVQNDASAADTFTVKSAAAPAGWSVKYYTFAGVDVTTEVTGATGWSTGTLAVGALDGGLYVKVTPISSITPGAKLTLTPRATSLANGANIDVGRLITTATGYQPDLWVRANGDAGYAGSNIFSNDGATQSRALSVAHGATAIYYLHVQNDGSAADTFTVKVAAAPIGWTVKYYTFAGVDVTAEVTGASGWSTGQLAVGAVDGGLYVKVTPTSSITPGSILTLTPKVTSLTNGSNIDVGRLVTTATGYQPDLWVRANGDAGYAGSNIFSNDGVLQRRTLAVKSGSTAYYYLRVQNDGSSADSFKLKSESEPVGWTVQYFTFTGNIDVTNLVTGANGWSTGVLACGATADGLIVKVTPNASQEIGAMLTLTPTAISSASGANKDVGQLVTTVVGQ